MPNGGADRAPGRVMGDDGLHLVQVSLDDSVFTDTRGGEALARQVEYARLLGEKRPGSQVTILVLSHGPGPAPRRVGRVRFDAVSVVGSGLRARLIRAWRLLTRLERTHRSRPISVVTTQTVQDEAWLVLAFCRLRRIPVIGQVHFDIFSARQGQARGVWIAWIRRKLTEVLLRYFDEIRVVGQGIAKDISARRLHDRVSVAPVPMRLLGTGTQAVIQDRPVENTVLFVGRLVPVKNLPLWLQVAKLVLEQRPGVGFELVGEGELADQLVAQVAALGLSDAVRFRGFVEYDDLPAVYAVASVFLLTSHYEGFGRVIAEAQAFGLPVVATRVRGVEDIIVDGETGFLQPPGDALGLANSVLALLQDTGRASAMGRRGRDRMRELYPREVLAHRWVDQVISVAESGRSVPQ